MKYEIYKKMTLEQQNEWNFRFNKSLEIIPISTILVFICLISMLIFMAYLITKCPELGFNINTAINLINITNRITLAYLFYLVVITLSNSIKFIYNKHKENKWLQEEGILK